MNKPLHNSVELIAIRLFELLAYFKESHPRKICAREISDNFDIAIRSAQRTLQAYEKSGWIIGDNASLHQGFRLSLEARCLLGIDPSKDPLQGLTSATKAAGKAAKKHEGIHI